MRFSSMAALLVAALPLAGVALPAAASDLRAAPRVAAAPSIQILSPGNQAAAGSTVTLRVKVSNFTLRPDLVGKAPTVGQGQYHIMVDGVYNNYSAAPTGVAKNLKPGRHQILVILANNDHSLYKIPATSSIAVQVGPAIEITSPAQGATIGPSVTLRARITGFTVNGADIGHKMMAGEGHWHVLIDGVYATASAGPTAVLTALTPGQHLIEAQLANNDHSPLSPPAYYDLYVTVGGGASSTGSSSGGGYAQPTGATHAVTVAIAGYAFKPAALTVDRGATVTWVNKDSVVHTATADGGLFDSAGLSTGQSYSHTFTKPGTYTYGCSVHPNMRGVITVR